MTPGAAHDPLRALFTDLLRNPAVSRQLGDMISDQDVRLPGSPGQSPWTGAFLPNIPLLVDGRRIGAVNLPRSGRIQLLLLDPATAADLEKAAAPWQKAVDVVHAEAEIPLPFTALLLRPDGYLAWTGDGPAADGRELERVLDSLLGRRVPAP
ncbi:aromatic-ring hydroxylase C-terminal domain-containing protein [Streptomyces thermodiastaticus]|uniref:aromatic-ring hydroxylase C-terminal domain-containing protein n=1 Tax=Streptomyces thermodiastaticus TaxID=44061 RepID=UPI0035581AF3